MPTAPGTSPPVINAATVDRARETIANAVVQTPAHVSATLSAIAGCTVVVKFENLQFTAAYKERGAANFMDTLAPEALARGVVAMSAGNHAQAVARHASLAGAPATIVMPLGTPNIKLVRTRALGATVVNEGEDLEAAAAIAHQIAADTGATFVPPFDDPSIIAGQGTVGAELLEQHPNIDTLVVPVGGGGLIAGIGAWARERRPDVEIIGVQVESFPAMWERHHGRSAGCDSGPTVAEGIAVRHPGVLTTALVQATVADMVLVGEEQIEAAMCLFLELEKTVTEGAGAAGLAAILADPPRFAGRTVGVIITGGNVDLRVMSLVIMRGLARSGRLHRLQARVADRPGALGAFTAALGEAGANIIELGHQRYFSTAPTRMAEVEVLVETESLAQAEQVVAALNAGGFATTRVGDPPGAQLPF